MQARIARRPTRHLATAALLALLLVTFVGSKASALARRDLIRFDVQLSVPFSDVVFATEGSGFQFSLPLFGGFVGATFYDLVQLEVGARMKLPPGIDGPSWDVIARAGVSIALLRARGWRGLELRLPLLVGYSHLEILPEERRYDTEVRDFFCFDAGVQLIYWFRSWGLTLRPLVGLRVSDERRVYLSAGGSFGLAF